MSSVSLRAGWGCRPQGSCSLSLLVLGAGLQQLVLVDLEQTQELRGGLVTHSSTLAWKTPWTEEPGGLQSMGLLRVGHD